MNCRFNHRHRREILRQKLWRFVPQPLLAKLPERGNQTGREYVSRPADERRQLLAGLLAHFPPMRAVLELSASAGARGVTKQQIAGLIERHSKIRKSTPMRRAPTLLAWLRWLESATGVVDVGPTGFTLR